MHERVLATEMKLHVLINVSGARPISEIQVNKYVSVNTAEPANSSGRMSRFFSVIKQIFTEIFSPTFQKTCPKRSNYA